MGREYTDRRGWSDGELLAFDLETTGVDPTADVPVSYALVRVFDGVPCSTDCRLVDSGRRIPPDATAVHGITDDRVRSDGLALPLAVRRIISTIVDASRRAVPLVGMKMDFDLTMVDVLSRRLTGVGLAGHGFCGPVVDVLVLDRRADPYRKGPRTLADLCRHYGVALDNAHDAGADAAAAAGVAGAICRRHEWLDCLELAPLHALERRWHRRWVSSFDAWRRREGLPGLEPEEFDWPVAGLPRPVGTLPAGVAVGG